MIGHQWTGPNGSDFDLTNSPHGHILLSDKGIEGMGSPAAESFTRQSAALAGQRFSGYRVTSRDVFWPIVINGSDGLWFTKQRAFWDSLPFGEFGVWRVTAPDSSYRELTCRFADDGAGVYNIDPSDQGVEEFGVSLVADDPYWRGPLVSKSFQTAEETRPFFESEPTHVFNIMSANTVADSSMANPGEIDAWPVWKVQGPATAFSLGAGGPVISADMVIRADQYLQISTDPSVQVARLFTGSSSVLVPFSAFTSIQFARVPRGDSVPIAVILNGSGSVEASFHPGYRRAF